MLTFDHRGRALQRLFGGRQYGGKEGAQRPVCMDARYNITPGDCVVFGFGINNDFSFEDSFADFGCMVGHNTW